MENVIVTWRLCIPLLVETIVFLNASEKSVGANYFLMTDKITLQSRNKNNVVTAVVKASKIYKRKPCRKHDIP